MNQHGVLTAWTQTQYPAERDSVGCGWSTELTPSCCSRHCSAAVEMLLVSRDLEVGSDPSRGDQQRASSAGEEFPNSLTRPPFTTDQSTQTRSETVHTTVLGQTKSQIHPSHSHINTLLQVIHDLGSRSTDFNSSIPYGTLPKARAPPPSFKRWQTYFPLRRPATGWSTTTKCLLPRGSGE